ncbi:MAG: carboxypeptidase-like regulatory domain-containing protein [Bacteroidales bacterium]|nr:carboxypeptidase-like regulatory domain-containing protein [Bacteroidales bacterium]
MRRVILLFFVFLFQMSFSQAQMLNISGTVISSDDGATIPGVSVLIKGTTRGTTTDISGKFKLAGVDLFATLIVSCLGFDRLEVIVQGKTEFAIQLKPSVTRLDEFVVTALGVKRQKREIGYSTEKNRNR